MGLLAVGLELDAVLEIVVDAAVHVQTDEPAVETGAAVRAFEVAVLVTADDVAAHLGRTHETGLLVAVFRLFTILRECSTEGEQKAREGNQDSFHLGMELWNCERITCITGVCCFAALSG